MDRGGRTLVSVIGVCYIGMATQLTPPYFLADLIPAAPLLWEVVFVAAGMSCLATAVWPRSAWPWIAGVMLTLAAASRGIAVLVTAIVDPEISLSPAIGWTMLLAWQIHCWPYVAPRPVCGGR